MVSVELKNKVISSLTTYIQNNEGKLIDPKFTKLADYLLLNPHPSNHDKDVLGDGKIEAEKHPALK